MISVMIFLLPRGLGEPLEEAQLGAERTDGECRRVLCLSITRALPLLVYDQSGGVTVTEKIKDGGFQRNAARSVSLPVGPA